MKYAKRGSAQAFIEAALSSQTDECILWPYKAKTFGYGQVGSDGKNFRVHRLICEKAHGPPPTPRHHAAHSCDIRACCNPRHLRWATPKENIGDTINRNRRDSRKGEDNHNAVLSLSDVKAIRAARADGVTPKVLGNYFGVTHQHIRAVVRGVRWPS